MNCLHCLQWAIASKEDMKTARNVQDWCRHDMSPLSQCVPNQRHKGLPLRADLAKTIILEILHNLNVIPTHSTSTYVKRSHKKRPTRPSQMHSSVMRYLCPSIDLSLPEKTVRKSHRKTKTSNNRDTKYTTILDSVARKLHQLPNLQDGWVKSVCSWLSNNRNFATTVKKMREHYFRVGDCIMYRHRGHDKAILQKRTGSLLLDVFNYFASYLHLCMFCYVAATVPASYVDPNSPVTRAVKKKVSSEHVVMEYCVGVGNQHVQLTRRGDGDLTPKNTELTRKVEVKTTIKAGEDHVRMRNSERSTALAKQYNVHKERNRKVLFTFEDLLEATIGLYVVYISHVSLYSK